MALKIYPAASPTGAYSQEGAMTTPLRLGFDGRVGAVEEIKKYLRNDNASFTYATIVIDSVDGTGLDITDSNGFSWKLSAGDTQPTSAEWDSITAGDPIAMDDISDTSTYLPFWIRIEIPRGANVASYKDVVLRITAEDTAVP